MTNNDCGSVRLAPMSRELCHELYRGWTNDPSIYADMALFRPFVYDKAAVDRYYDAKQDPSRMLFAVMLNGRPIGELQLKHIDPAKGECTLSIHLQNDAVKGKGYGTAAERLAVRFAFSELGLTAVNADTIIKNTRSQRVLEKVGFRFIREEDGFRYYRMEKQVAVCADSVSPLEDCLRGHTEM